MALRLHRMAWLAPVLVLVGIAAWRSCAAPPEGGIRALLEQRLAAAEAVVKDDEAQLSVGTALILPMIDDRLALLEAECALGKDRAAETEKAVAWLARVEADVAAQAKQGVLAPIETIRVQAARLEMEVALARLRGADPASKAFRYLLDARFATAQRRVQAEDERLAKGTALILDCIDARQAFARAESDVAADDAGRAAAAERLVAALKAVEARAAEQVKSGLLAPIETTRAKAARLEAEVSLRRLRGAKPEDAEFRALLDERLAVARERLDGERAKLAAGTALVCDVIDAREALLRAEFDLSGGGMGRVGAAAKSAGLARDIEAEVQRKVDDGVLPAFAAHLAKRSRIEAEVRSATIPVR